MLSQFQSSVLKSVPTHIVEVIKVVFTLANLRDFQRVLEAVSLQILFEQLERRKIHVDMASQQVKLNASGAYEASLKTRNSCEGS